MADAGELPNCNLCGLTRSLAALYPPGAPSDLYGLRARVDGAYQSAALQDCTAYKFALCEFCLDWLFSRCAVSPVVCDVDIHGADEGTPPRTYEPASARTQQMATDWAPALRRAYEQERVRREAARIAALLRSGQFEPAELSEEETNSMCRRLLNERSAMLENLSATQARCTELLERVRELDRHAHVQAFCRMAGQAVRAAPGVPAEADLRLGLSLIVEEGIVELLEAALDVQSAKSTQFTSRMYEGMTNVGEAWIMARAALHAVLEHAPMHVDLPALVDATIDTDYVVEGLRCRLGVVGDPIWVEVHEANLRKRGGPKDPVTGKHLKPSDWQAPDVLGLLEAQGYKHKP